MEEKDNLEHDEYQPHQVDQHPTTRPASGSPVHQSETRLPPASPSPQEPQEQERDRVKQKAICSKLAGVEDLGSSSKTISADTCISGALGSTEVDDVHICSNLAVKIGNDPEGSLPSGIFKKDPMNDKNEDNKKCKSRGDSSANEEARDGGMLSGNGSLKKGPWTSREDAMLVDYIKNHGEGNWNAVQKHSGLSRCRKSCRLRWANHLRPGLKKGPFTMEEERRITELHFKIGNQWALMAAELPGRTNNDIKNFWKGRKERLLRAGLPLYPPDIVAQVRSESQKNQNTVMLQPGDPRDRGLIQDDHFEIPFPTLFPAERLRESEFPGLDVAAAFNQLTDYSGGSIPEPFGICSQYESGQSSTYNQPPQSVLYGSRAVLDGNTFSSEPIDEPTELEFPWLQYLEPHQQDSFGVPASLPPSLDALIRSPPIELELPGLDVPAAFNQLTDYSGGSIPGPFGICSQYESGQSSTYNQPPQSVLYGSRALLDGNTFSSEPICGSTELEFPSLPYSEHQQDSWGVPASPSPSLEFVDTLIQTPPTEQAQSDDTLIQSPPTEQTQSDDTLIQSPPTEQT